MGKSLNSQSQMPNKYHSHICVKSCVNGQVTQCDQSAFIMNWCEAKLTVCKILPQVLMIELMEHYSVFIRQKTLCQ